jgi:hypothetical protein
LLIIKPQNEIQWKLFELVSTGYLLHILLSSDPASIYIVSTVYFVFSFHEAFPEKLQNEAEGANSEGGYEMWGYRINRNIEFYSEG